MTTEFSAALAGLAGIVIGALAAVRLRARDGDASDSDWWDAPSSAADELSRDRDELVKACVWIYESAASEAVRQRAAQALGDVGVQLLEPAGQPYDPTRHIRVSERPAPRRELDSTVVRSVRPGVIDGDVVVRPAEVVVYVAEP